MSVEAATIVGRGLPAEGARAKGIEFKAVQVWEDIPRISVPQAWTVCGSPAYTLAARSIVDQIARHDAGGAS